VTAFELSSCNRLGQDVDGRFQKRLTIVVIEDAASHIFELVVADDFGILRNNFVAHLVYWVGLFFASLCLRENVNGRFQKRLAVVVIENATGDIFELLVADGFRALRNDFVAHVM
jgi:hypothetical protein